MRRLVLLLGAMYLVLPQARAAEQPSNDDPVYQELLAVREGLIGAYNKRDLDALLEFCDEDIIVTWQNAEVSRGREGVRAYYKKMMEGDDRIVDDLQANPTVDDLAIIHNGDAAISRGAMNDTYRLRDGSSFALNSRWSATLIQHDGKWLVSGFHASTNAFDNDILRLVAKKSLTTGGAVGIVLGLLLGIMVGRIWTKRKQPAA